MKIITSCFLVRDYASPFGWKMNLEQMPVFSTSSSGSLPSRGSRGPISEPTCTTQVREYHVLPLNSRLPRSRLHSFQQITYIHPRNAQQQAQATYTIPNGSTSCIVNGIHDLSHYVRVADPAGMNILRSSRDTAIRFFGVVVCTADQ